MSVVHSILARRRARRDRAWWARTAALAARAQTPEQVAALADRADVARLLAGAEAACRDAADGRA